MTPTSAGNVSPVPNPKPRSKNAPSNNPRKSPAKSGSKATPKASAKKAKPSRYTPPTPKTKKVSPMWVPVLMFALLGVGIVVIVTNYLGLLPGEAQNRYLLIGLVEISAGFMVATQYR
ncbi:MAG: cell division protein CrgA [Actinomycetes bacterium]